MILLDTDHLSVLEIPGSERRMRLVARLALAGEETIGTTIVNVEEQMRGWMASIAKERLSQRQVPAYNKLAELFEFFRFYHIALFTNEAADQFDQFTRVRIGAMDRKIASIAISNNALLLTANKRDFEQVPACGSRTGWMNRRRSDPAQLIDRSATYPPHPATPAQRGCPCPV